MAITTSVIHSVDGLEAIRGEWADLLARSATNEVMQSPIWLINWWRIYGSVEGRSLQVLQIRYNGRLVGLAPFCSRRVWHFSRLPIRCLPIQCLELLGSGEKEEDETCSEYIGMIAEVGFEQRVADAFGQCLHNGTLGPWEQVVMTAMSSDDVMVPLVARALGTATRYEVLGGAPFVKLPESWEAYLKALPSSRRYLVKRSIRDWETWAKSPPQLQFVETEEDFDKGYRRLLELHRERWQEDNHAGAFESDLFSSFHLQTMRELFEAKSLWLCWLQVEGEVVAVLYNIAWNKQVRFYQSGRKVDLPKKIRPGIVLHACAIRAAIESGFTHYDFLAGTTRYKMQLANNVRPLLQLSLLRPGVKTRLLSIGTSGIDAARDLRRAWRAR